MLRISLFYYDNQTYGYLIPVVVNDSYNKIVFF